MDHSNGPSRSRAPEPTKPSPASRGEEWMLDAVRYVFTTAMTDRRG